MFVKKCNFAIKIVAADGLALLCVGTSADTAMKIHDASDRVFIG